jgi:hypothetical protein
VTEFVLNADLDWRRLNREHARRIKAVWFRAQLRYVADILADKNFDTDPLFAKLRAACDEGLRLILSFNLQDRRVPAAGSEEESALFARVDECMASFGGRVEVFAVGNEYLNYQPDDILDDGTGHYPAVEFQRRLAAHIHNSSHISRTGNPVRIYAGGTYTKFTLPDRRDGYATALYAFARDTAHIEGIDQHIYDWDEAGVRDALTWARGQLGPTKKLAFFEAGFVHEQNDRLEDTLEQCIGVDWCTLWNRPRAQRFIDYYNQRASDPATPGETQALGEGVPWLRESSWHPMLWDLAQDYGPTEFAISTGAPSYGMPEVGGKWPDGTILLPADRPPFILNQLHSHITQYDGQQRLYMRQARLSAYLTLHEQTASFAEAVTSGTGLFLSADHAEPTYFDPNAWGYNPPATESRGMSAFDALGVRANAAALRLFGYPVAVTVSGAETTLPAILVDEFGPDGGPLSIADTQRSFHFSATDFAATAASHGDILRAPEGAYRIIDTQPDEGGMVRVSVSARGVNVPA